MSFAKILLCWGSIKSPFNIHKFNLCILISLGPQVQTYVKKKKSFWKTKKKECNLDKTKLHIFKRKWDLCPKNLEWISLKVFKWSKFLWKMILGKQKEPCESINPKHWYKIDIFLFITSNGFENKRKSTWITFFATFHLKSRSLIDDGRKFIFTKRKNDFYSIQKNQLDNFKRITTQTNILFELLNQEMLKQINKIRFKTIIFF